MIDINLHDTISVGIVLKNSSSQSCFNLLCWVDGKDIDKYIGLHILHHVLSQDECPATSRLSTG